MPKRHLDDRGKLTAQRNSARAQPRADWADLMPRANAPLLRGLFAVMAAMTDIVMIAFAALVCGILYHNAAYGEADVKDSFLELGLFVALLFTLGNVMRNEYSVSNYLAFQGHGGRSIMLWNLSFICALAFAFVTKTTSDFSRATIILFYPVGFALLMGARFALVSRVRTHAEAGTAPTRRVFLVGYEKDIGIFTSRYEPWSSGMRIVTAAVLRGESELGEDLALAAATARVLRPDDVFILVPWSESETIDACVNAFLRVPASIHLGPEKVLDRFVDARISKFGMIASLNLVGRPLSSADVAFKRLFDLVVSVAGLILILPFLACLAVAIKIDSRGPVLFFQKRYGFNQEPFNIVKFRSMSALDDGRDIEQATQNDPRITRVGRVMRRLNLDELPQLLNVIRGQMSLVGPRPHALAHDQKYETAIALYARRHNMRPGITGWAQINGFRGETATDDMMRRRVEHDLFYIDNWSFLLDLRILVLTIFSKKAYRNAV